MEIDNQDSVVIQYLINEFNSSSLGQYWLAFIFVSLLAAGMSTLDGILVSLSSMVVNDLYLPFIKGRQSSTHQTMPNNQQALAISRGVLIAIGLVAGFIALDPPALIGLFAQKGVYTLAAASTAPILLGVLMKSPPRANILFCASILGGSAHLIMNLGLGIANPAVSATYAIFISLAFCFIHPVISRLTLLIKNKNKSNHASSTGALS